MPLRGGDKKKNQKNAKLSAHSGEEREVERNSARERDRVRESEREREGERFSAWVRGREIQ